MNYQVNGLGGLLVLIADIWAIVNIVQSSKDTAAKLLPVLGFIIWLIAGPRKTA